MQKKRKNIESSALVLLLEVLSDRIDPEDDLHDRLLETIESLKMSNNLKNDTFLENENSNLLKDSNLTNLREIFSDRLSISDLNNICFDLKIDQELFFGLAKDEYIRNLLLYCERRNLIKQLKSWLNKNRNDIDISSI